MPATKRTALVLAVTLAACTCATLEAPPPEPARAQARSIWSSPEACAAAPLPARRRPRIATWNVRWFPDGSADGRAGHATDVAWLACTIAHLGLDAIALQEILLHERGRAALATLIAELDRLTGGRWEARDDGCPPDHQHLVILVDTTRARIVSSEPLPSLHPDGAGCAHHLRPGLATTLRFHGGLDLTMVTLHLDSGTSERDHGHRRASMARLPAALAPFVARDPDVVVLGDLNTMGMHGVAPDAELAALDAELRAASLVRVPLSASCTERSGSHRAPLDHVAVSARLHVTTAHVAGPCAEGACRSRASSPALDRLSDHCPVVIDLGG